MKNGIGPNNLGVSKRTERSTAAGKMYKSPAKLDTDPPKNKASFLARADANIANRAQQSARKPAAKKGSMQEFLNDGPVPFVKRGYNQAKRAVKKVTSSTYGTSIK